MPVGLVLVPEPPRLAEYLALRRDTGLRGKTDAQGVGALRGSWAFCHVRDSGTGRVVAMGRVIGDGGWYFTIADIATLPDYQRRGLGRHVVEWLLQRIWARAPQGAHVTLIADPTTRALYERAGFRDVTEPHRVAMQMVLDRW